MTKQELTSIIGQLEITYRVLSRAAAALSDANGSLVTAKGLPETAMSDKIAPVAEFVNAALISASVAIEECAVSANRLFPKSK